MARESVPVEVNKFNAGLNTDASPLTGPDNTILEGDNMVFNLDGSSQRRLGIDLESGFELISTSIPDASAEPIAFTTYRWHNAGGNPDRSILVVQSGNELKFFALEEDTSVSPNLMFSYSTPVDNVTQFSYTVVDGMLVVVNGTKQPMSFEFIEPNTFNVRFSTLYVRDLWGVEDIVSGVDLSNGSGIQVRPATTTDAHTYNLTNQGWGIPRIDGNNETLKDPIVAFTTASSGVYPSNSDVVTAALYPDAEDTDNRTIDRFFAENLFNNPLGTTRAAQGYYIIDALERGVDRLTNFNNNLANYPDLSTTISTLPQDTTPGGATVVGEFAGRVWYGGFSGDVINGDGLSPRLSSYVLFSRLVRNFNDINQCYQEGDPTSKFNADIIDTDGGFIRLNEAYGIQKFVNSGPAMLVVASNGIWRIVGGTDGGFTATRYIVEKLTGNGCYAPGSVVNANGSLFYWGEDGIYQLGADNLGTSVANSISKGRIQKLFDSIPSTERKNVKGFYDAFERKIRWVYNTRTDNTELVREIILDIDLQAFYTNVIYEIDGITSRIVTPYVGDAYLTTTNDADTPLRREMGYVVVTDLSPVQYSFARYSNQDWRDWYSLNAEGVDAAARMVTSQLSGNDFLRDKSIPFLVVHSRRTENGFEMIGDQIVPINQSSCIIRVRWDWSDSNNSNRWTPPFQAYRYRRLYMPVDVNDPYDNGFETVMTKNKIRGNGKVLSIEFSTEPYRDMHLYGWSLLISVAGNP